MKQSSLSLRVDGFRFMRKCILACLIILCVGSPAGWAASRSWTGNASGSWSNPNNWDPVGVPENGDFLSFFVGNNTTMINDLANLSVDGLRFDFHDYALSGNPLTIEDLVEARGFDPLTVTINCALILGDETTFDSGNTEVSAHLRLNADINLNGRTLTMRVASGGRIEVAGSISGIGNVELSRFSNVGTIEFLGTADNTFTGTLLADHFDEMPTINFNKEAGSVVTNHLNLRNGVVVHLRRPHQIGDNATVTLTRGSHFLLHGHTETIKDLRMEDINSTQPSLVDTDGSTLSVIDDIVVINDSTNSVPVIKGLLGLPPGPHTILTYGDRPSGLSIEAAIIGDGGFTKTGSSTLFLSGNSSFGGDAILHGGAVAVTHSNALGSVSGATILTGARLEVLADIGNETLLVNSGTYTNGVLSGALVYGLGTCSWAGPVVLGTNLNVAGWEMTFSGPISGSGGMALGGFLGGNGIFFGTVRYGGNQPNTYTGPTIATGALLEFNKPSGVPAFGGSLIVGNGGGFPHEVRWLQNYQRLYADVTIFSDGLVNLNNHAEDFGPITFTGGTIDTGSTGELGIYGLVTVNPANVEATINGRMGLPVGTHEFRVGDGVPLADLMVNAVIVGSGGLRKTGPGQMWLNASNSYVGVTLVDEGSLVAFDPHALGGSGVGTIVSQGGSLILNSPDSTVGEPITIAGTGDGAHGALNVFGSVTLRNPFLPTFSCLDLTTNATIRVESGGLLTVDGIVSGIGPLTKTGPGTLVFANANPNTYSGDTFVNEGVLNLSKPSFAISVPGNLIVGPAALNSSAIARWSTSGGMNPGAIATINARSLLDLNGNGQSLSRLNLNDGGDAQTGAGRLDFPFFGMVAVGSLSQLGSHAGSSFSGNIGLAANATLTFAVNAYAPTAPFDFNPELDVSASMAAPAENPNFERAGIAKTGTGTMRFSGNNSFNGRVDVTDGALIAAGSLAFGTSSDGTFVLNGARLALEGSLTVESEILVLNSSSTPALESLSGESYWSGPVILNRHTSVGARASSLLQLAGVISGAANFTKVGAGTLRFGGGDHNSYTGETFVNEGMLLLSKPLAVTAVPGPLSIGTAAGTAATVANLTSYQVVGNIFVNRGGLLNVNGQVENVDHLWLSEGGDVQTTSGVLSLKTGGSIEVLPGSASDPATIAGNLEILAGGHNINVAASTASTGGPDLDVTALVTSGGGSITLQKNGAGKLRFSANNTYDGSAIVYAGSLQVDGSQPSSGVVVLGGAQLSGHGRVGPVFFGSSTGVVAPGTSPGNLQVGHFNQEGSVGGILHIELNGLIPGTEYDRLTVRGLAHLNGMTLQGVVNFAPAIGVQFMIVGNDFLDEITGEFNGLPQGASVTFGDHIFQINYFGGDGNDVVLTKIGDLFRPRLTIERATPSAVRLLWPTNDPAFTLQSTTNLSGTNLSGWILVPDLPVVSGTNRVVTIDAVGARKFYRLIK